MGQEDQHRAYSCYCCGCPLRHSSRSTSTRRSNETTCWNEIAGAAVVLLGRRRRQLQQQQQQGQTRSWSTTTTGLTSAVDAVARGIDRRCRRRPRRCYPSSSSRSTAGTRAMIGDYTGMQPKHSSAHMPCPHHARAAIRPEQTASCVWPLAVESMPGLMRVSSSRVAMAEDRLAARPLDAATCRDVWQTNDALAGCLAGDLRLPAG